MYVNNRIYNKPVATTASAPALTPKVVRALGDAFLALQPGQTVNLDITMDDPATGLPMVGTLLITRPLRYTKADARFKVPA